jgi:hypothetical protein
MRVVTYRMGLAGEYGVRRYYTRRNVLQLTFNFLAGNQEAEEDKALIKDHQSRTERLSSQGVRTAMTVPGIVKYLSVGQSWKGCGRVSVYKLGKRKSASGYQEEAVNERHGPKMGRISGAAVSIRQLDGYDCAHEKGMGVVRIRSSPVRASTS